MSMDERTLTALKGSIAKWEGIVAGTGKDLGADNCPLCQLFIHRLNPTEVITRSDSCRDCPVALAVGTGDCDGTPYYEYDPEDNPGAAQEELTFLKSLLPEVQS